VVCLDVADLIEPEHRWEVLKLRRRVQKLTALLRLVLAELAADGADRDARHAGALASSRVRCLLALLSELPPIRR
jgi:hypothetical protein